MFIHLHSALANSSKPSISLSEAMVCYSFVWCRRSTESHKKGMLRKVDMDMELVISDHTVEIIFLFHHKANDVALMRKGNTHI